MRVLVGDIGGTKTGLAVAEVDGDQVAVSEAVRYPSGDYGALADIVRRYLDEAGAVCDAGSFAIAGPVVDRHSKTTNLPWEVDAAELEQALDLGRVHLLNDLEAVAWGVAALGADDLAEVQAGEPDASGEARGNACVVAPGTGLGEAGLYWDGERHHAFATEGGHTDFAPTDQREFALLQHLQGRFGRVSWERVVSGMGIGNIYSFLADFHRAEHPPAVASALAGDGDLAAAVAESADSGCPVCAETMDLFAVLFGREAGNMALKHMALGGVYLGGGIAPKNLDLLRAGGFQQGFLEKGRMRSLMERMPVRVILNQQAPLLGAGRFAAQD
ncbi:MAG: glucokinase [Thiohalocapsa sp.]|uniref:glucokinase n=1 Tax=Thiohalocapsa sp. TaxID=2497641 RepID=UPI0025FB3DFA|nr:glucokinase [Thiohalocapsa sp.]MCG6943628.1 glucokinase [Thiohalocapsa sp.]